MDGALLAAPTFIDGDVAPLAWLNAPVAVPPVAAGGALTLTPDAKSDFWSGTFYGFPDPQPHSGHVAWVAAPGDFVAEVTVATAPLHRYDQAGLFLEVAHVASPPAASRRAGDGSCWVKCSVEHIPDGPSHVGCVVTNDGFSDWSTSDVASGPGVTAFRMRRLGADVIVEARGPVAPGTPLPAHWTQLRMAHLHAPGAAGAEVRVGVYAAAPLGAGCTASFTGFTVRAGRLAAEPAAVPPPPA